MPRIPRAIRNEQDRATARIARINPWSLVYLITHLRGDMTLEQFLPTLHKTEANRIARLVPSYLNPAKTFARRVLPNDDGYPQLITAFDSVINLIEQLKNCPDDQLTVKLSEIDESIKARIIDLAAKRKKGPRNIIAADGGATSPRWLALRNLEQQLKNARPEKIGGITGLGELETNQEELSYSLINLYAETASVPTAVLILIAHISSLIRDRSLSGTDLSISVDVVDASSKQCCDGLRALLKLMEDPGALADCDYRNIATYGNPFGAKHSSEAMGQLFTTLLSAYKNGN